MKDTVFKICSAIFKSGWISVTGGRHLLYLLLVCTMFRLAITTEDKVFHDFGSLQTQWCTCAVNWGEEVISMSMMEIVTRLQIFFPTNGSKLTLQLLVGLLGTAPKAKPPEKNGHKVNPSTSSSQWFSWWLAGFQGADGASNILLLVCELLAALQSKGSVELVKMAALAWQKMGWVVAAAELHLERNSWLA